MKKLVSFLVGTAVGALIGSILALLFAPSSGTELRAQTSERFGSFISDIRNAANTKRIELQERLETLRAPRQ